MKNIVAVAFVGMLGVMTLGSCVKDYRCECVISEKNSPYPAVVNVPIDGNLHHKQAKKACDNSEKNFYNVDKDDVSCNLR